VGESHFFVGRERSAGPKFRRPPNEIPGQRGRRRWNLERIREAAERVARSLGLDVWTSNGK